MAKNKKQRAPTCVRFYDVIDERINEFVENMNSSNNPDLHTCKGHAINMMVAKYFDIQEGELEAYRKQGKRGS